VSELSQEALYNLCYSALAFADNLFQIWLTITFGVILAIYFSVANISPFMRKLLIGLYFGASFILIGRWCVAIMFHSLAYQEQIVQQGFPPFPTPPFASFLGITHLVLYLAGTTGTLYFMLTFGREKNSSTSIDPDS
jgi:hypothetical protein